METPIKYPQNWNHFIFQVLSPPPGPYSNPVHPWALAIRFLGLVQTQNFSSSVTCILLPIKPQVYSVTYSSSSLEIQHSHSNKLTLYKLLIRSLLTYADPVWSSTCSSNYLRLQVIQSKNIVPFSITIHWLTAKFFAHCPSHLNPLVSQIGNYTLADLTNMYRKYKHIQPKHVLL